MRWLRGFSSEFRKLSDLSILSFELGAGMMLCFYIVGLVAYLSAPFAECFFTAMAVYRGCFEAAPASFAAGVCAGLLGDLMLKFGGKGK